MLNAMRKPAVSTTESVAESRRIADISSARLWLAEGVPIADILTMLEVRRRFEFSPDDCRVYLSIGTDLPASPVWLRNHNRQEWSAGDQGLHAGVPTGPETPIHWIGTGEYGHSEQADCGVTADQGFH
ncbi:MAG: hypothetical protein ABSE51_15485 [Terracidiphilus sp.]|jgi:hypothetical protein